MKLSEFIRGNHKAIVAEWETFAGTLLPAARAMSAVALRDHAEEILEAIVDDLSHHSTPIAVSTSAPKGTSGVFGRRIASPKSSRIW